MAILHVMVGYMGFGKSTLAGKLSKERNAIILNHDEFMMILLGRNPVLKILLMKLFFIN